MAIELGCTQFEEAVSDYIEGALAPDVAMAMRRHAHRCSACAGTLDDVRQALGLLAELPERDIPHRLEARILQRTLAPREALGWQAILRTLGRGLLQPKFVLGFSMAVFAFALVINAAGINLAHLQWTNLTPSRVTVNMRRNLNRTLARGVAYYNDLRVVYEIQAALHQMRQGDSRPAPDGHDRSERNLNRPLPSFSAEPSMAAAVSAVMTGASHEGGMPAWQGNFAAVAIMSPYFEKSTSTAPTSGQGMKHTNAWRPIEEV